MLPGWSKPFYYLILLLVSKPQYKLIVESSYFDSQRFSPWSFLKRFVINSCSEIHCASKSSLLLTLLLNPSCLNQSSKTTLNVINGVGILPTKDKSTSNIDAQHGNCLDSSVLSICSIVRISDTKNIPAILLLSKEFPDYSFNLVFSSISHESLKLFEPFSNIDVHVSLSNSDVLQLISESDYLFLPSLAEPRGFVVDGLFWELGLYAQNTLV